MRHESSIAMEAAGSQDPALTGNFEAEFEELFHRHQRAVYGWILRIVRDSAAAEDLTIEAFWRMYCAHARYDPARDFGPWARKIATHVAIDWLRRRRPETPTPDEFFLRTPAAAAGDPAIAFEVRQKVTSALQRLSPKLRVAVLLGVIEERPQKEVADALGISVTAVKLRQLRGLRLLRRTLERQGIKP